MPGPRAQLDVPSGHRRGKGPLGEATRGKTAPNRLRRLDLWLLRTERDLLLRPGPEPCVDLGYGRLPLTTAESARSLRMLAPHLPVVGVEVDPARVEAAEPWADERTSFRLGGFDLPLTREEGSARVIRALNVLRQYEEDAVPGAWQLLGDQLADGGLLIEGTSDPLGRLMVVQLLRKTEGELEDAGLLFSTNLRPTELEPAVFRAVLPKRWIHRVHDEGGVAPFLAAWERCWASDGLAVSAFGRRQVWRRAAEGLAAMGWDVTTDPWLLRRGFLAVRGLLEGGTDEG